TLEEFVEAFHAAVAAGQSDAFRSRFGAVDVLLVDDVQFLTNRREMQNELLRLTNTLQSAGRQMVLASDRPPSEIADLDERLVSRFSGGLVVDIGRPEFETRLAILRRRSEERGVEFESGVLEAIAGIDVMNVRELLGALNRLIAFQAVSDAQVTPNAVMALLIGETGTDDLGSLPPPSPRREAPPVVQQAPPPVVEAPREEPRVAEPVAAAEPAAQPEDEFADFMTGVRATVAREVEAWKLRVSEAVIRWEGEGYRTARLSKLLDDGDADTAEAS